MYVIMCVFVFVYMCLIYVCNYVCVYVCVIYVCSCVCVCVCNLCVFVCVLLDDSVSIHKTLFVFSPIVQGCLFQAVVNSSQVKLITDVSVTPVCRLEMSLTGSYDSLLALFPCFTLFLSV